MQALTRKRLYDTGILFLGVLVVWGVISADESAELIVAFDKLVGIALLFLARRNVPAIEEG